MMRKSLSGQRLVGVFLLAVLLFNYPVLSLFDASVDPITGSAVALYLFLAWAAVILAVAWIVERGAH